MKTGQTCVVPKGEPVVEMIGKGPGFCKKARKKPDFWVEITKIGRVLRFFNCGGI
jgi:hypothetical protein